MTTPNALQRPTIALQLQSCPLVLPPQCCYGGRVAGPLSLGLDRSARLAHNARRDELLQHSSVPWPERMRLAIVGSVALVHTASSLLFQAVARQFAEDKN